ncbi:hypothetical protein J1N35_030641 [Gossypium stocksii]|uniref:Uncharacterized protein n=1 Tax=Gossypium stocksii TaxID=47602 RepID=A0A9D3V1C5_9ROSI|nr:hypothetical protein J1N35_030641 [Gossypium stocksii]
MDYVLDDDHPIPGVRNPNSIKIGRSGGWVKLDQRSSILFLLKTDKFYFLVSFYEGRKIWGNEETGSRNIHGISPSAELNQTTKTKLIQNEAGPILKKESNPIQPVEEEAYDVDFSYIKGACSQ